MQKPPSSKPGRPRNEVPDPDGNPVPYLGSYERKNRQGKTTKIVYYSYWLDENDLGNNDKPKKKKHYYEKPYPAVIILPFSKEGLKMYVRSVSVTGVGILPI